MLSKVFPAITVILSVMALALSGWASWAVRAETTGVRLLLCKSALDRRDQADLELLTPWPTGSVPSSAAIDLVIAVRDEAKADIEKYCK